MFDSFIDVEPVLRSLPLPGLEMVDDEPLSPLVAPRFFIASPDAPELLPLVCADSGSATAIVPASMPVSKSAFIIKTFLSRSRRDDRCGAATAYLPAPPAPPPPPAPLLPPAPAPLLPAEPAPAPAPLPAEPAPAPLLPEVPPLVPPDVPGPPLPLPMLGPLPVDMPAGPDLYFWSSSRRSLDELLLPLRDLSASERFDIGALELLPLLIELPPEPLFDDCAFAAPAASASAAPQAAIKRNFWLLM